MSQLARKTKVAIIGGGPAGLTAAFELTADGRADDYDVTIYQQGWRLGGKCTSGRNPDPSYGGRIEEHGLHVFFGCYENTRRVIQGCLEEMDAAGRPYAFRSFDEAFEPIDTIVLGQSGDGLWSFNEIRFPRDRTAPLNFGGFVSESLTWAGQALLDTQRTEDLEAEHGPPPWWPAVQPILAAVGLDDEVEAVGRHLRGVGRAASRMQRELTAIFLDVDSAVVQGRRPGGRPRAVRRPDPGAPAAARRRAAGRPVPPRHDRAAVDRAPRGLGRQAAGARVRPHQPPGPGRVA